MDRVGLFSDLFINGDLPRFIPVKVKKVLLTLLALLYLLPVYAMLAKEQSYLYQE